MKIRGKTVERCKDYNAATHVEELRARQDRLAKINKAMPPQAHIYMKARQKAHQQVKKFIREDRG